jgi:hypothetical protein
VGGTLLNVHVNNDNEALTSRLGARWSPLLAQQGTQEQEEHREHQYTNGGKGPTQHLVLVRIGTLRCAHGTDGRRDFHLQGSLASHGMTRRATRRHIIGDLQASVPFGKALGQNQLVEARSAGVVARGTTRRTTTVEGRRIHTRQGVTFRAFRVERRHRHARVRQGERPLLLARRIAQSSGGSLRVCPVEDSYGVVDESSLTPRSETDRSRSILASQG